MAVLLCPRALIKKHYILVLYHGRAAVSSCFDKKALYFGAISVDSTMAVPRVFVL